MESTDLLRTELDVLTSFCLLTAVIAPEDHCERAGGGTWHIDMTMTIICLT